MSEDIKKIMTEGVNSSKQEVPQEVIEKVNEIKGTLMDAINILKADNQNNIPFSKLHEVTALDYSLISDVILTLIMEKKLLGFINDGGTESFDDDILILRDKRLVDDLEPDYETGYS